MKQFYSTYGQTYLDNLERDIERLTLLLDEYGRKLSILKSKGYKGSLPYENTINLIKKLEMDLNALYDEVDETIYTYMIG